MTQPKTFLFTNLQNLSQSHQCPAVAASAAHSRATDIWVKTPGLAGGADRGDPLSSALLPQWPSCISLGLGGTLLR